MNQFMITIYSADPRKGARPCSKLFLLAASQAQASANARERLAAFPWIQLDVTEAQ